MKKSLLLSIVLVLIGISSFAQWQFVNPAPTGNTLTGIDFIDTNTGFIIGTSGTILKTSDGGTMWENQSSGTSEDLLAIYIQDPDTVSVCCSSGKILNTNNGGTTWNSLSPKKMWWLSLAHFINVNTVFAIEGETIFKTTNGGLTWDSLYTASQASDQVWTSICFPDQSTGYVFGWVNIGMVIFNVMMKTTDGGITWTESFGGGNNAFFLNADTGFATSCGHTMVGDLSSIGKTTDGGATWNQVYSSDPQNYCFNDLNFPDANTGYAVGTSGTILKTINGGTDWTIQSSGTPYGLNSVCFHTVNTGYAVGESGTILKTTDGGSTWIVLSTGTTQPLTSVFFTDDNTGHVVGLGLDPPKPYLNTINGGATWTSVGLTGIDAVYSVYFTDASTGYAAGMVSGTDQHYGIIQKTTDGGTTWTTVLTGYNNSSFKSIYFTDATTGYAVNTLGTILKTIDGGTTWTPQISGTTNSLNSVYFTDSNIGYIVGIDYGSPSSGFILKTNNGGTTWNSVYNNGNQFLYSVFFTDDTTGYTAGFNLQVGLEAGIILKTTDGGTSWTAQYAYGDQLNSIYFTDANHGYAVGVGGTILKTADGGSTWITQASGTTNNLNSVFFTDDKTGYAVGDHGTILKTSNGGAPPEGINEKQQTNNLKVFPNPASEKITIEMPEPGSNITGSLSVYGVTGQELIKKQVLDSKAEINVNSLPHGIYFIRMMNSEKTWFGKFIKE